MTRDDAHRDPLLAAAFADLAHEGASSAAPDTLAAAVKARVRRRRAARQAGAGATGLAVVAAVALGVGHLAPPAAAPGPGAGPGVVVSGDYPAYSLRELAERADVVLEGTVVDADTQAAMDEVEEAVRRAEDVVRQAEEIARAGGVVHPAGPDVLVGWFCASERSGPFTRRDTFDILGVNGEEWTQLWDDVGGPLKQHCDDAIIAAMGGSFDPYAPNILLVGPDLNDLSLSARLDPEVSLADLCVEIEDEGWHCTPDNIRDEFLAAFPGFDVDEECFIVRVDDGPAAAVPAAPASRPATVRTALVVDTVFRGVLAPGDTVVVAQTPGSDWEPPLVAGQTYLIFGELRPDGAINILGGSAGGFVSDGEGGFVPMLDASGPVERLTAADVELLLLDGAADTLAGTLVPPTRTRADLDGEAGPGTRVADGPGLTSPAWTDVLDRLPAHRDWVEPNTLVEIGGTVLYVTYWGPENCPAVATGVRWDGDDLLVTVENVASTTADLTAGCSAELTPHTTILRLPEGSGPAESRTVVVEREVSPGCVRRSVATPHPGGRIHPFAAAFPDGDPVCAPPGG